MRGNEQPTVNLLGDDYKLNMLQRTLLVTGILEELVCYLTTCIKVVLECLKESVGHLRN